MKGIALRVAATAVFSLLLAVTPAGSFAQGFPSKLVRIIVPVPAGGSTDVRVRLVADKLSQGLGKQVVVENRPGADGVIGTEMVARAAPDGHTLLATFHGTIIANPVLYKKLRYDPVNDFEHITQLIATTII
ncbi:MAG: tripartite tricarboxylate transporter substrate binding protein, partial [Betaproteobacteria bacterium]|nr:tripartite tricarboxylate transporter substrate binding protein [Betaproteobacteria bacterium]